MRKQVAQVALTFAVGRSGFIATHGVCPHILDYVFPFISNKNNLINNLNFVLRIKFQN